MSSSWKGVKKGFHTFSPLFYKITRGASPQNSCRSSFPFFPNKAKERNRRQGKIRLYSGGGRASGRGPLCPKRLTNIESPSSGASHDFIKMRRSRFRFPSSLSAEKHFAQMPQKKRRTPMRLLISHLFLASAAKAKNSLMSDV